MVEPICYLDGRLTPLAQATVSVMDRGFIFGDAIYEVIPVFDGVAFRLSDHLQRLSASLAAVSINNPLPKQRWISIIEELINTNGDGDQSIYIQVSRGVAPRDHVLNQDVEPTVFLMSSPLNVAKHSTAISAVTVEDVRWQRCDIKSTSLLANVMSRTQAIDRGSQEAIFIRNGYVTEAAASNVFIVHKGVIKTPPLTSEILAGVTRNLIVELLEGEAPKILEEAVTSHELTTADEVWVTSSTREIVPVNRINDKPVGDGEIGPTFLHVDSIYQSYKTRVVHKVDD
jgi:D-alanine transaminase